jgi:uridine phosphorylase
MSKLVPIIDIPYEIPPRVLVCGDPVRAERIANRLDAVQVVAKSREYWTFSGTYRGIPVAVSSHGVGAAGAHVSFEGLILAGAQIIIRVGTCGTLQPSIPQGALIIATAACREEGVTQQLIPLSYPAVASLEVVQAMLDAAAETGAIYCVGIVSTGGIFYKGLLPTNNRLMAAAGCLAFENEAAMLFVTCSLKGVKAGCVVVADGPCFEFVGAEEFDHYPAVIGQAMDDAITIALESIIRVEVPKP